MISTNLIRVALVSASLAVGSAAFAADAASAPAKAKGKGKMSNQTHHCMLADGSMDMTKTRKACVAAKGKWSKDAAAMPAAAASK